MTFNVVTKSSSWGAQDKPANETKETEVATNQPDNTKPNSNQNVNNNANDNHGDGAWNRPRPANDQDPPPSRYQPPRRDEDRFSLRKDEFPSLKDQPPKESSSQPHQYERPNYNSNRDYNNNSNGYDRRSDYGREQRRPSESNRYVGNNRDSRYSSSRDERPPRYENEENRSYGNVTIKSKEATPHPESHIKVESVHRSFIATPKDWALEAEEDTERVQREDTEK